MHAVYWPFLIKVFGSIALRLLQDMFYNGFEERLDKLGGHPYKGFGEQTNLTWAFVFWSGGLRESHLIPNPNQDMGRIDWETQPEH